MADGCVAVKWEENVSLFAKLTHEPFGLASLTVQFDVLGKGSVYLSEGTAQAASGDVHEVLQRVHVVIFHKVLPVMKLQQQSGLHGLLAGEEVGLHEQDVLPQLPDFDQFLHEVKEQWVDLLQLQDRSGYHQSQVTHGGATHLVRIKFPVVDDACWDDGCVVPVAAATVVLARVVTLTRLRWHSPQGDGCAALGASVVLLVQANLRADVQLVLGLVADLRPHTWLGD